MSVNLCQESPYTKSSAPGSSLVLSPLKTCMFPVTSFGYIISSDSFFQSSMKPGPTSSSWIWSGPAAGSVTLSLQLWLGQASGLKLKAPTQGMQLRGEKYVKTKTCFHIN